MLFGPKPSSRAGHKHREGAQVLNKTPEYLKEDRDSAAQQTTIFDGLLRRVGAALFSVSLVSTLTLCRRIVAGPHYC